MVKQEAISILQHMEGMGHPQPATPIRTDNSTAQGIVNGTIKQKRSRTFDRQYWWLKDRISQLQFNVTWDPGVYNLADYYTKHHPGSHHERVRPIYLYEPVSPRTLQGCIKIMNKKKDKARALHVCSLPVTKTTVRKHRCSIIEGIEQSRSYIKLLSKLILNQ